jgi:hypothetical protein
MKNIKWILAGTFLAGIIYLTACKKNETKDTTPDPPAPVIASQGKAIIYLKQDCNLGNVLVTIDGVTKKVKDYASSKPNCDSDSSYAAFTLKPGSYTFQATGETNTSLNWNGSITVVGNECNGLQLTCSTVTQQLKGQPGYPRLNMQHSAGVDFDIHVIGPDNIEINSFNTSGSGGKLDLQSSCLGNDVNPGSLGLTSTVENLWYPQGKAMHGTYKFWVQYGNYCAQAINGSYTLRLMNGLTTVKTYTGTLTTSVTKSPVYTITY